MILYGSSLSPFVRKVLVFAAEKDLALNVRPAGRGQEPAGFKEASPFGKIPALKDGDFLLSDSTAIIAYLDAIKPEPDLVPLEPRARARTVWYEEFADTIAVECVRKAFFNRIVAPLVGMPSDEAAAAEALAIELPPILDYIEGVIPDSGHLVEDRLTLADIAVACPFVNLSHLGYALDPARHPKTVAFAEAILGRPSFAALIAAERKFLAR